MADEKSKRKTWTVVETKGLLKCYLARKDEFLHLRKKRNTYAHILEDMLSQGLTDSSTTVIALENKMRTLLSAYKSAKDNASRTGASPCIAPFMEEMDEIFGTSILVTSVPTLSVGICRARALPVDTTSAPSTSKATSSTPTSAPSPSPPTSAPSTSPPSTSAPSTSPPTSAPSTSPPTSAPSTSKAKSSTPTSAPSPSTPSPLTSAPSPSAPSPSPATSTPFPLLIHPTQSMISPSTPSPLTSAPSPSAPSPSPATSTPFPLLIHPTQSMISPSIPSPSIPSPSTPPPSSVPPKRYRKTAKERYYAEKLKIKREKLEEKKRFHDLIVETLKETEAKKLEILKNKWCM